MRCMLNDRNGTLIGAGGAEDVDIGSARGWCDEGEGDEDKGGMDEEGSISCCSCCWGMILCMDNPLER